MALRPARAAADGFHAGGSVKRTRNTKTVRKTSQPEFDSSRKHFHENQTHRPCRWVFLLPCGRENCPFASAVLRSGMPFRPVKDCRVTCAASFACPKSSFHHKNPTRPGGTGGIAGFSIGQPFGSSVVSVSSETASVGSDSSMVVSVASVAVLSEACSTA